MRLQLLKSLFITGGLFISGAALSQTIIQRDVQIDSMVRQVSADSLKVYINKLVSFGTRSTLSSTTDKNAVLVLRATGWCKNLLSLERPAVAA